MKCANGPSVIALHALFRRASRALTREDRRWLFAGCFLALASSLSGIALLAVAGHFITAMALAGAGGVAINYYTPAALIRLLAILRTGGRYAERLASHAATLRILSRLRIWIFRQLIPLSPHQLRMFRSVELLSRLRADVDALEQAYLSILIPGIVACSAATFVLVAAVWYLPSFAVALSCAMLTAGLWLPRRLQRRSESATDMTVTCADALRLLAVDSVQGRAELALYGAEAAHADAVKKASKSRTEARHCLDDLQVRGAMGVLLAAQLTVTMALALGIPALRSGHIAPPDLTTLAVLAIAVFEAMGVLPDMFVRWHATRRSAERIAALIDQKPSVFVSSQVDRPPLDTALSIRGLCLQYEGGNRVLNGVDLDLPSGCRVALSGASGAGKSSLVGALLRLHPYQGQILLGGRTLDSYSIDESRACFAVAEQHPYLFDASLRENLCLGRPLSTDAQLKHVIDVAQLSSLVATLPQGLDTLLGENGMRLSGGEVRRIAIARAMLFDAPILILDEPTEGLDVLTADTLLRTLAREMVGRTILVITHRRWCIHALAARGFEIRGGRAVALEGAYREEDVYLCKG